MQSIIVGKYIDMLTDTLEKFYIRNLQYNWLEEGD
jgi:hypothetical protein